MTFTPEADVKNHVRLLALYDDGSTDMFAVPECTLQQGPGAAGIARLVAGDWQRDGKLQALVHKPQPMYERAHHEKRKIWHLIHEQHEVFLVDSGYLTSANQTAK